VRSLELKLIRDAWSLKAQAGAIALVIIGGIATWIVALSTIDSLSETQNSFYQDYRFASIFAGLKRAPEAERSRIEAIPGVETVETRVQTGARFRVEGFADPIDALITSIPDGAQPRLNRLHLASGRLPDPERSAEIVLVEAFAEAHGLDVGDRIESIIRGRKHELVISGIGSSPEYVYFVRPGDLFPDYQRYAIAWMGRDALGRAADMDGAFNSLAIEIRRDAQAAAVIESIDQMLARWGGTGAYDRDDQISHRYLSEELKGLEAMARVIPLIFLGVAGFLLSIVIGRLVRLQRDQIAVLKAFGYPNRQIAIHYVLLMLIIVLLGLIPGILIGSWLGQALSSFYVEFYRFPDLRYRLAADVIISGITLTVFAAALGTFRSLRTAFSLPPAEAMRPEPPSRFRSTLLERLPIVGRMSQPSRMILRNLERHPVKALLSITGIALATAILVTGYFQGDTLDHMLDVQFGYAAREDLTVMLNEPRSRQSIHELAALPGVIQLEPFRMAPVELIAGHRRYRTVVQGMESSTSLHRIVDRALRPIVLPESGLLLTDWLAEHLGLAPGDSVELRLLERDQPVIETTVIGLAREFVGVSAYMEISALNRLLKEDQTVSGAYLSVDPEQKSRLFTALQDRPAIAGTSLRLASIESFNETMGETRLVFAAITSLLAGVIAFGVIYNTARLALSERGRELASLRVLGFRRRETAQILLGELALLTLLALPFGFAVGYGLCWLIGYAMASEFYRIPTIVNPDAYAYSAIVVLIAALLSAAAIGRRLYNLDLIAVLKTRE
jgi:putative ABC transport system permease protein